MKLKSIILLTYLIFSSLLLGQTGNFLQLDGTSGYVVIPDHTELDIDTGEDFTITCWVKSSDFSSYHRFIHKRLNGGGTGYEIMNNLSGHIANNLENTENVHVGSPNWSETILLDGNWHHVAMVVNSGEQTNKIYIDGILQNNCTATSPVIGSTSFATNMDLYFGFDTNLNDYFPGSLDEIRFWNSVLSNEEISIDMNNTISGTENELIAAWDFENTDGATITDISGNGHNGSLVGGAFIVDPNNSSSFVNATISQTTLPTGRGNDNSRVMLINILTSGTESTVSEFNLTLAGTNPENINNIDIFYTGANARLDTTNLYGTALPDSGIITIEGSQSLIQGSNNFWLTYDISQNANEGEIIDATCESLLIDGNSETPLNTSVDGERIILLGHKTLFSFGEYNSAAYRIPAICTAMDGSLIAAGDARVDNNTDLPGNIDISVRRSSDNGVNWSEPIIIADFGNYGASDPALVVDRNTGDILCLFASHQGLFQSTPQNRIRTQLCRSTDNGLTWSDPIDISDQVYAPSWYGSWVASGSAHQTRGGRIVAAVGVRPNSGNSIVNHMIYSDDGGYNWNYAENMASTNGNEAKIVELNNGNLMMNIRNQNYRKISISEDGGLNWGTPYLDTDLIDPFCNADLIRYTSTLDGYNRDRLLFSNPKHSSARKNLHVFMSVDEGDTWQYEKQIYDGNAAYSGLTILQDGTIGLFYENGEYESYQLSFARFSLDWLTDGEDYFLSPNNLIGDVNSDEIVNILDILLTVNYILGNEFNILADVNNDGILNILDAIIIVNIILG